MERRVDRMLRGRLIDREQHEAATRLRDAWDTAGLRAPEQRDPTEIDSDIVRNEAAWQRYCRALAALPRDARRVVVASVVYDEDPIAWGRRWNCDGLAMLRRALERLANHWRRPSREKAS